MLKYQNLIGNRRKLQLNTIKKKKNLDDELEVGNKHHCARKCFHLIIFDGSRLYDVPHLF